MATILPPFDGPEHIFNLVKDIATALGPGIAGSVGSVITPMIVQAIKNAQAGSHVPVDIQDALRRTLLANATLLAIEQSQSKPEGFWGDLGSAITKPYEKAADAVKLTYRDVTGAFGMVGDAADKLANDVAREITCGLILRAQLVGSNQGQAESAMETDSTPANKSQVAFMQELAKATATSSKEEGIFDDIGNFVKDTATTVGNVLIDNAPAVGKTLFPIQWALLEPLVSKGVPKIQDLLNGKTESAFETNGSKPEGFWTDLLNDGLRFCPPIVQLVAEAVQKPESAFDDSNPEGFFEDITKTIKKVSEALILHNIMADGYLTKQMARPVPQLKEEGFFDDVGDFFKKGKNVHAVGINAALAGGPALFIPVVGPILGGGLLIGGLVTAIAGDNM